MRNLATLTLGILLTPLCTFAAIAFDTSVSSTFTNAGSKTISSYPATASNPYVVVQVTLGSNNDAVTGVTFNSHAMTQLTNQVGSGFRMYLYGIAEGGTHDITTTVSGSEFIQMQVTSYSGVNQSTPTDGTSVSSNTGTDASAAVTSTVTNDWFVSGAAADASFSAGVGSTQREFEQSNYGEILGDSNGPQAAGSYTMHWTLGASKPWAMGMVALQPAATPAVASNFGFYSVLWW